VTSREILSDITVYNKYAKHTGTRRENWFEIVMRTAGMHAKKFPELEKEIYKVFGTSVLEKKVVPSMRSLQFAGKPIELSPNRLFNCAYTAVDDYRAFSEIMFLLLGGSGVGFSIQARHISQLPPIVQPRGSRRYVVQDNIIGWSEAIRTLMKAYFFGRPKPRYVFDDIREKGMRLITSGGKAPGAKPLKDCLFKIESILESKKVGSKLTSIEVFDIMTFTAEAVLAGGIRRSATICLFDPWDYDMLTAKTGEWYVDNPQRAMANISAVLDRRTTQKEEFEKVFKMTQASGSGEPGFMWTNDPDMGVNPLIASGLVV